MAVALFGFSGTRAAHAVEQTGSISGTVFADRNSPGSTGDVAVGDVEVRLSIGLETVVRRTGPDGKYAFAGLAPGRYVVSLWLAANLRVTTPATLTIAVETGRATGGVNFGIAPRPRLVVTATPLARTAGVAPGNGQATSASASAQGLPLRAIASPSPLAALDAQARLGSRSTNGITSEQILAGLGAHWQPGDDVLFAPRPAGPLIDVQGAAGSSRPIVTSLELPRHLAANVRAFASETALWLGVPFRTQIDGTEYSKVNCGPASLAMALSAFGMDVDPAKIRDYVNYLTGDYDRSDGTGLDTLGRVAREAGLRTYGPSGALSYRHWSFEDIRTHVRAGHPVITLVKYRSLPGNAGSLAEFDHYIVITGLSGDDLIYNDAAFATSYGFNLLLSRDALARAWSFASIPNHAVAVGMGDGLRPLPNVPSSLMAASLAAPDVGVEPPLAMLPGAAARWLRERMLAGRDAGSTAANDGPPPPVLVAVDSSVSSNESPGSLAEAPAAAVEVMMSLGTDHPPAARNQLEAGQPDWLPSALLCGLVLVAFTARARRPSIRQS